MSLIEQASLVITPNAVKASKLYAIKPIDGTGDLAVVRATTATRVNKLGLIEQVPANVPRLDYTNGSCPSILVEPQRTNLLNYSKEFDNASWVKGAGTLVTSNTSLSPSGLTDADLVYGTNFNIGQNISATSGIYIFSVYLKATGSNIGKEVSVRFQNSPFPQTILTTNGEWQRVSITITIASTTTLNPRILIFGTTNPVSEILAWGAQLEAGSYATSYIPTLASAVTRNADVISKIGISSLINSQEGVLFCEISALSNDITDRLISLTNSSSTERISVYFASNSSNLIKGIIFVNGAIQCNFSYTSDDIKTNTKIALKYKENDFSLYVNGIKRATDNSGITFPANKLNKLSFDLGLPTITLPFYGNAKMIAVFPIALSDVELSQLTTL